MMITLARQSIKILLALLDSPILTIGDMERQQSGRDWRGVGI